MAGSCVGDMTGAEETVRPLANDDEKNRASPGAERRGRGHLVVVADVVEVDVFRVDVRAGGTGIWPVPRTGAEGGLSSPSLTALPLPAVVLVSVLDEINVVVVRYTIYCYGRYIHTYYRRPIGGTRGIPSANGYVAPWRALDPRADRK